MRYIERVLTNLKPYTPNMKRLVFILLCLSIIGAIGCAQNTKPSPQKLVSEKNNFSIENRIMELRKRGELFDSCQFLYQGNCFYRLCGSNDLATISDTSLVTSSSHILVTYVINQVILT